MKPRVLLTTHNTGTAFWRVRNPLFQMMDMGAIDLTWLATEDVPMRDRFWYNNFDVLVLHQEWSDGAIAIAQTFKALGKRVIVSLDDLVAGWQVPRNIGGGRFYQDRFIVQNVKDLLELSDRIVVTQPTLKNALAKHFEIDERKFRVMPNMPSFDWAGRMFNARVKADRFKQRRGKVRIGVLSSLSHYEIMDERMKEEDDFQIVVDAAKMLEESKVKVVWVLPLSDKDSPLVKRLTNTGAEVDVVPMAPITAYPKAAA